MQEKQNIVFILVFIFALIKGQAQIIHVKHTAIDSTNAMLPNLKELSTTHSELQSLYNQKDRILDSLHKNGYLEAYSQQIKKENDTLYKHLLFIGNKTNTAILHINTSNWPKEITNTLTLDKHRRLIVPFEKFNQKIIKIQSLWENHGYSFAETYIQNIKKNNDTLYGDLYVTKKEVRKVDSIIVKGYEKFPIKILQHRFGLKQKKKLNLENIKNASQTIEATGIARETRDPEILYEKDKSTVFFYFEKTNNNYFDGIIGFATNEDTGKLTFSGNLDVSLHNNLNKGEKLTLYYQADEGDQQEMQINLESPYIGNTSISASGGIHIFKKDSTYTTTNLTTKIKLDKRNWTYYIAYEKIQSVSNIEENTLQNHIKSLEGAFYFLGSSYTRYQRDQLQPLATYADIRLGTGKRRTDVLNESQLKLELEGFHTFTIANKHSLFTKAQFNKLWSKTLFTNELFRVGGIKNIRGFGENSIDASQAILLQTEYRYRLSGDIYMHSITDLGWVVNKVQNTKDQLIGIGLGIGIHSNIGLMHVQIANGITGDNKIDFDKTRIHISLLAKF